MIERIEINLLPAEYRVHKRGLRLQREIIYPLLVSGVVGLVLAYLTMAREAELASIRQETETLRQEINKNKFIKNEITRLRNDHNIIQEKIRGLELINVNREKWVSLLEILCSSLPPYMWLTSVEERSTATPPTLQIQGLTFSFPEVASYMTRLRETDYISAVDLSNIEQIGDGSKAYRFGISGIMNPDAAMAANVANR